MMSSNTLWFTDCICITYPMKNVTQIISCNIVSKPSKVLQRCSHPPSTPMPSGPAPLPPEIACIPCCAFHSSFRDWGPKLHVTVRVYCQLFQRDNKRNTLQGAASTLCGTFLGIVFLSKELSTSHFRSKIGLEIPRAQISVEVKIHTELCLGKWGPDLQTQADSSAKNFPFTSLEGERELLKIA
jgi:hypothetical protein